MLCMYTYAYGLAFFPQKAAHSVDVFIARSCFIWCRTTGTTPNQIVQGDIPHFFFMAAVLCCVGDPQPLDHAFVEGFLYCCSIKNNTTMNKVLSFLCTYSLILINIFILKSGIRTILKSPEYLENHPIAIHAIDVTR